MKSKEICEMKLFGDKKARQFGALALVSLLATCLFIVWCRTLLQGALALLSLLPTCLFIVWCFDAERCCKGTCPRVPPRYMPVRCVLMWCRTLLQGALALLSLLATCLFIVWWCDAERCCKVMKYFVCLKLYGTSPLNMSSQLILLMERHWTRWSLVTRNHETWYDQVSFRLVLYVVDECDRLLLRRVVICRNYATVK